MRKSGGRRRGVTVGFVVVLVAASGLALAGGYGAVSTADAATDTEVYLSPVEATIGPSGTATYDVVVGSVRGGIGSYDITVSTTSPSVAEITGVSNAIGGQFSEEIEDDGSEAQIGTFAADAVDNGTDVAVARVTVTGDGIVGRSSLLLNVHSISDESGTPYGIDGTETATVRVRRAQFRMVGTTLEPNPITPGQRTELTVRVENTGPVAGETTVIGLLDGTTVGERTVNVSAGDTEEVTFGMTTTIPGTHAVRVTGPDIASSSTSLTVRRAPFVGGSNQAATDPDGDGRYEDVNGDGEVTPGDATVLFDAVFDRDPVVADNVAAFDFNGDGDVTPGDATALFLESL